jgi:hypothetical protein
MAEDTAPENVDSDASEDTTPPELGDAGQKALAAERSRARDAERRAKVAEKALETERAKGLTETERTIAEAKAAGRTEATLEAGKRLARAEIRAAAATEGIDVASVLEDLDLSRFVGEDGEPDTKAIEKAISRWAGIASTSKRPRGDVDQGTRTQAPKNDMNTWMRQQVGVQ